MDTLAAISFVFSIFFALAATFSFKGREVFLMQAPRQSVPETVPKRSVPETVQAPEGRYTLKVRWWD